VPLEHAFYLWYSHGMRLTIQLKLLPTPEQADVLNRTLIRANAACDYISQLAWGAQTFGQFPIHRLSAKENRKTQASFICTSCGFAGPADVIAAGNIASRALVSAPYYSEAARLPSQSKAAGL
jgi:hypothetical protein